MPETCDEAHDYMQLISLSTFMAFVPVTLPSISRISFILQKGNTIQIKQQLLICSPPSF